MVLNYITAKLRSTGPSSQTGSGTYLDETEDAVEGEKADGAAHVVGLDQEVGQK